MTNTPLFRRLGPFSLAFLFAGGLLLPSLAGPHAIPASAQDKEKEKTEAQGDDEDSKLARAMQKIRAETRGLGKAIEAKDQAAAWKSVCAIQAHILEAKQETPLSAEAKPPSERPAFVNAFRAKISSLLKASCDLEAAVLASKFDEADKVLHEMVGPMQKAGHREFRNN